MYSHFCFYNFQLADECEESEIDEIASYEINDTNQNGDTTNIEYCEKTYNTRQRNKNIQNGIASKSKVAVVKLKTSIVQSISSEPVKVSNSG